jgi:hypothetical protein
VREPDIEPLTVASLERAAEGVEKALGVERFRQVEVRIDRRRLRARVGRHDDDGDARELRIALLSNAKLPAVHDRHSKVEENDVRRTGRLDLGERLLSVDGRRDLIAVASQKRGHGFAQSDIVFDDEHTSACHARW